MEHKFKCSICKLDKTHVSDFTTGYGRDKRGRKICFECCGKRDLASMLEIGNATLYLSIGDRFKGPGMFGPLDHNYGKVTNWPGSLVFALTAYPVIGRHNMAGKRYDVYFHVPNGKGSYEKWHGIQYGDNTQILHCKKTK